MRRAALLGLAAVSCGAPIRHPADTDAGFESSSATTHASSSFGGGGTKDATSTTEEPETDTEDPSTTTGPECSEVIPCLDPEAPFCVEGTCTTCDATEDPNAACLEIDEAAPLCVGTECVQCSAESVEACSGTTPLCGEANTCVACRFHEECEDIGLRACNIATGACFSADAADVTEVDLNSVGALQTAIGDVPDGAEHTILITGGNGSPQAATIDGGKVIAIVSNSTAVRTVSGNTASPIITVNGAGSTAYLHRLRIDGSNGVGISVATAGTLYADSTQVSGNDGGGIELASGTSGFLRNCMVGGSSVDVSAVLVNGGNLEALYTSILGGALDSYGLRCTSGSATVRNSIVTTRGDNDALVCPGASVSNSPVENAGNPDWFTNYNAADASLTATGQTEFADEAVWENGDPPFDFEGDERPTKDGANDYPGADVP